MPTLQERFDFLKFPLIPLPIKEAIIKQWMDENPSHDLGGFH